MLPRRLSRLETSSSSNGIESAPAFSVNDEGLLESVMALPLTFHRGYGVNQERLSLPYYIKTPAPAARMGQTNRCLQ